MEKVDDEKTGSSADDAAGGVGADSMSIVHNSPGQAHNQGFTFTKNRL